MRYVLDANMVIAGLNGVEPVRSRLSGITAADVGIPVVAIAELYFDAYKSQRRAENLGKIRTLLRSLAVLPVTESVAELYGSTRAALEVRGLVRTDFDLIIACIALDLKAVLVTDDRNLLDGSISNLQAENWLA